MSDQPTPRTAEQQVSDLIADGRITTDDADAVLVFAQFLRESGPAPSKTGERFPPGHPLHDLVARRTYTARWMPYLQGEADGPVDAGADRDRPLERPATEVGVMTAPDPQPTEMALVRDGRVDYPARTSPCGCVTAAGIDGVAGGTTPCRWHAEHGPEDFDG